MVTSETQIANLAATLLGPRLITSLDETSDFARIAKVNFSACRDATLRAGLWSFASWRAQLAALTAPVPAFTYGAYFQLPNDFIRLYPMDPDFEYNIEGSYIAASETRLDIRYIRRITNVTLFDPLFVEAFAARLAWKATFKLTQTSATRQELWEIFLQHMKEAKSADAQQKRESWGSNTWIDARE